jgi:tetratricopeptide (TPR) repeat protein
MSIVRNNLAMLFATATPPRLTEAMGQIDQAIEISPGYPEFLDSRGDILALLEREPEAVESYLAALEKAPFRIQTHQKAIVLMEELGQLEQAEAQRGKLAEAQKAIERQQEEMKAAAEQQKKSPQPNSESGTGLVPGSAASKPNATEPAQETANSVEPEQPGVKEKPD